MAAALEEQLLESDRTPEELLAVAQRIVRHLIKRPFIRSG